MSFLSAVSDVIWGPWMLGAFLLVGGYYSFRTGFFQVFGLPVWWRATVGSLFHREKRRKGRGAVTQLQALSTALAATIGTGSVAGVATAIFYGGPGAVFWMWLSAFVGMMTGCAEKILAVRYREKDAGGQWRGGPMTYIRKGLRLGWLAEVYALFCVAETLAGGNLAQANSIATSLHAAFGVDKLVVGIVLAVLTTFVLLGGIKRVGRLSELLVPLMAGLFIICGLVVIAVHWRAVPAAISQIVGYAFSPKAVVGGYSMGMALRFGVARGVFTNEAGLGMSAIAHACADVEEPAEQGMWGIFEVFCATLVICTVTSLVILTAGVYSAPEAMGMIARGAVPETYLGAPLTAASFGTVLGKAGEWVVAVCSVLFAFTSLLGAGYYGQRGIESLTGRKGVLVLYRLVFPVCIVFGCIGDLTAVWQLVDLFNGLLALPNLTALLLLSPEVMRVWKRWTRGEALRKISSRKTVDGRGGDVL